MYYFTADLHISHRKILQYCNRPFNTVEEMNEHFIENINEQAKEKDTIVMLGDFYLGVPNIDNLIKIRRRIRSKHIIYIWGNHDKKFLRKIYNKCDLFQQYIEQGTIHVYNQALFVNHYAMLRWDRSHHGVPLIFGHSHSQLDDLVEKLFPTYKMLDVGIDGRAKRGFGYTMWSFDEIIEYMRDKVSTPHHE